jgi:glutathione S-transferase
MIELIQFPWSPYCIVQRRLLEFSGVRFKTTNVSSADRSRVWKLTRQRYYQLPVLRDNGQVLFEVDENSQVIAKYLNEKLGLGLFPEEWRGVQTLLWQHIEGEVEGLGFKLNDSHWREFVPARDQLGYLRHKERKFGRGCLEGWAAQRKPMLAELAARLAPYEQMLATRPFLLARRPLFVDFDLCGILGNFLYSGHYRLPATHPRLQAWYQRMTGARLAEFPLDSRNAVK